MAKRRVESWVVTDDFWQRVEPLIPVRSRPLDKTLVRKPGAGRPPKPARQVFAAVMYVLRTGCQWKALPAERFGSASAVHKRFLAWEKAGLFEAIWKVGLAEYDQMDGIAWRWQSLDGAMLKAPLAQEAVGPNPTDREKNGSKRHLLVNERGVPLSLIVTGANVHDALRLEAVLKACVIKRPLPKQRRSKHLCADAGYYGKPAMKVMLASGYIPHVVGRAKERATKRCNPTGKARRWVVELSQSWFSRFKKLLVRYEKLERSLLALNHLAAAVIAFGKVNLQNLQIDNVYR